MKIFMKKITNFFQKKSF